MPSRELAKLIKKLSVFHGNTKSNRINEMRLSKNKVGIWALAGPIVGDEFHSYSKGVKTYGNG
jgi:hypothetical protein